MFLEYVALVILIFVALVFFYGIIAIRKAGSTTHNLPKEYP